MSENVPQTASGTRRLIQMVLIILVLAALAFGAYMIYDSGRPCGCTDEPVKTLDSGLGA